MMKTPKKWTKASAQKFIEKFIELYPVGTHVVLQKDFEKVETVVKSEPWTVSGNVPVCRFEGVSGGYLASRVLEKVK